MLKKSCVLVSFYSSLSSSNYRNMLPNNFKYAKTLKNSPIFGEVNRWFSIILVFASLWRSARKPLRYQEVLKGFFFKFCKQKVHFLCFVKGALYNVFAARPLSKGLRDDALCLINILSVPSFL